MLPVIVVNANEMLGAGRIRALLDYFSQHAEYVVAATHPEEGEELKEANPIIPVTRSIASG